MSSMIGNRGPTGMGINTATPKGYEAGRMQNFTPEQMQLFKQMFSQVGPESQLGKLASGDEATFKQMEAPALRQFAGLQSNLANRFSGQGLGGRKSSGFQQAAGAQASNFAQELQANRQNLMRQALQDMMGISNDLLGQRPYQNYLVEKAYREKTPSFGQNMLGGLAPALGTALGAGVGSIVPGLGTAVGGALGGVAGNFVSNLFSGK